MEKWYRISNEFTGSDATMTQENIADVARLKANQFGTDSPQGLPGMITDVRQTAETSGIKVERCGDEPGSGKKGCGSPLSDGEWKDYTVKIGDEDYQAYKCFQCKHELKPFDIEFSKKRKEKRKRNRQKSKRLSNRITLRRSYTTAATPAMPGISNYNNPANQMMGRLDLSEDARVIPWSKMDEYATEEYDDWQQRNRKTYKIVKVKGKNGQERLIRIEKMNTGGDGVSPAGAYRIRGKRKKDPRYNPGNPRKGNPGAWPHNRDDNEGWYQSGIDKNRFNSDMRERVISWSDYIRDRGNVGLLKPY